MSQATRPYADGTKVAPEASRAEIERTLTRYGTTAFVYGTDELRNTALVQFRADRGRIIRFLLPLPDRADYQDRRAANGRRVSGQSAYDAEVRRRWRSLANAIKAKLDAVATGIVSFEDEFLGHVVLPDDTTVGQWAGPQIARAYASGAMPEALPGATSTARQELTSP
jgi:hypothetical protein